MFSQTPDGRAIMHQDAFFWRAMEVICAKMNQMMAAKMQKGK